MTSGGEPAREPLDSLARWRLIGVVATVAIVLLIPLSLAVHPGTDRGAADESTGPTFVGRERCAECHESATSAWTGSGSLAPSRRSRISSTYRPGGGAPRSTRTSRLERCAVVLSFS